MFDFSKKIKVALDSLVNAVPALRTTTIEEDLFIQGKSFSYEDYHLFGADEEKIIIFDPTNCTCNNIDISPILYAATSGPFLIDYYRGITEDESGSPLIASNRKSSSPILPKVKLSTGADITDFGTRISGDLIPSTGLAEPNFKGATSPTGLRFEIGLNFKWAVKIKNLNGANVYFEIKLTWFEK
jgi:hypothetical protein